MTEPGFRIESIRQAAPFRARAAFGGYQAFGDGNGAVLVEPATAQSLREAAENAFPKETGGLLSGRTLRDSDGPYVLVSGFVQAGPGAGRSAAFEISPQETALLREEAHRAHPTADVVGWWHSHLGPSSYSQTDFNTQAIFTQPDSVGLLVFARDKPWAAAYMGPEARKLGYPAAMRVPGPDRPAENGQVAVDPPPDQPVLSIPGPPAPGNDPWPSPSRSQGLVRLLILMGAVLILILILAVVVAFTVLGLPSQISSLRQQVSGQVSAGERHLAGQVSSAQQQLSGELKTATTALPAPASVSYACVPALAPSGQFACTATPSVSSGEVRWYVDGKYKGSGGTFVVRMLPGNGAHHSVQAILVTSGGRYPAPVLQLSI
jgi:proteasome lid subunit RPN8/RPN11